MQPTRGTAATVTQMRRRNLTQRTLPARQAVTGEMTGQFLADPPVLARVRSALIDTYFTILP